VFSIKRDRQDWLEGGEDEKKEEGEREHTD
jgi:hypothetical protein